MLAPLAVLADTTEHYGKWERLESVSPLTDKRAISWAIKAAEPNNGRPVFMALGCTLGGSVRIRFAINEYLGTDSLSFHYRIDAGPIQEVTAFPDEEGTSLIIMMPDALRLLKQMVVSRVFALGVTPYGANPFETTFDINGIGRVVKDLSVVCSSWR
jgi:hypothetical protein